MRVAMASVLVSLFLFGCGKEEPASTSAADPAPAASANEASAGTTPSGAAPMSAAGASQGDAGTSRNGTANPVADPSGATPPLSSSQSSPRLSPAPGTSDSAATPQNGAENGAKNGAKNGAAPATPARKAATPKAGSADYTIRRGDTLAAIAKKHGLEAKDLARWNGIDDPRRLRIGQKIRLSAPGG